MVLYTTHTGQKSPTSSIGAGARSSMEGLKGQLEQLTDRVAHVLLRL